MIDLCHGKIQLSSASDHVIYRHQFFAFLTYSHSDDKISIQLLELPSLFDKISDPEFNFETQVAEMFMLQKISLEMFKM